MFGPTRAKEKNNQGSQGLVPNSAFAVKGEGLSARARDIFGQEGTGTSPETKREANYGEHSRRKRREQIATHDGGRKEGHHGLFRRYDF
ncbi:MAG: hypothetical protein ACEQSU_06445 [Microgenomates group bacterium]